MMRRGVEIKEAGLGLPLGRKYRLVFRVPFVPFPLTINPLLLGAYVEPTDSGNDRLNSLSFKDRAVCYSAGVLMNIYFAGALLVFIKLVELIRGAEQPSAQVTYIIVVAITTGLLVVFRRKVSLVTPIIGSAILMLIIGSMIASLNNVGGPKEVVSVAVSAHEWLQAMRIGAVLSLNLAPFNMLPIVPLDGGRVVVAFLEKHQLMNISKLYQHLGSIIALEFIVFVLFKDFW